MSEDKDYINILDKTTTLKEMGFFAEKFLEELVEMMMKKDVKDDKKLGR